ncbi:hypothetical protein SELMODRAFT_429098 [Selaginella moellendorffii]|uniref:Terpene synthase n=1 Tax=Selaginella moellendorffii TaxID=88036 RepID=D8T521_SELML|nr:hypothetical protein SELMODRAFT_429098 [Selaginella moellendorffii]
MAFVVEKIPAMEHHLGLKRFYLPPIRCSIPSSAWDPDHKLVAKLANEWAFPFINPSMSDAQKLSLERMRIPLYMSMLVLCGSTESAVLCGKFAWFGTMLDDLLEDESPGGAPREEFLETFQGILHGTHPHRDPVHPSLEFCADLIPRLRSSMAPRVYAHWVAQMEAYAAFMDRSVLSLAQSASTVESYLARRRLDCFLLPCFPFIEMSLEIALPDSDLESRDYLALQNAINDHVLLVNDVISFPAELRAKKPLRSIASLQLLLDPSINTFQESVDRTCAMIQEKEREVTHYYDVVMRNAVASGNAELVSYLQILKLCVPNNLKFHFISSRYGVNDGESGHGIWIVL